MQTAEDRMIEYLRERTALLKEDVVRFAAFRRKFYAEDCRRDNREGILKESESETIINVSTTASEAEVITGVEDPKGGIRRLRYRLRAANERWLINRLEIECPSCKGETGNRSCEGCHGTGWLVRKTQNRVFGPLRGDGESPRQDSPRW